MLSSRERCPGRSASRCAWGWVGEMWAVFSRLLVTHFGAARIRPTRHQFDANELMAMRAFGANRVLIQIFEIGLLGPHQLKAPRTGFYFGHSRSPSNQDILRQ